MDILAHSIFVNNAAANRSKDISLILLLYSLATVHQKRLKIADVPIYI
jgi:hypothetical protein